MKAWKVIAASMQGTSHQRVGGTPCQDAYGYEELEDGTMVIAVSDGAGTASQSDKGSKCAVAAAVSAIKVRLAGFQPQGSQWFSVALDAFAQARQALETLATDLGAELRDLYATLTLIVVSDETVIAAQLGDGLGIGQDESGELFAATHPQKGEYANETFFLTLGTTEEMLARVNVWIYHCVSVNAVAGSSDGLLRLAMQMGKDYKPFTGFWDPLLKFAATAEDEAAASDQLAGFLDSERICSRTDDDKTLVIAVRTQGGNNETP